MDTERFRRVEELFEAAAERSGAERDAFLAHACAGDPTLRAAVEALLAHDRADDDGDIHAAVLEATRTLGSDDEGGTPQHLGPYRIEREIGRGGMGHVWLGVRDDEVFHKRVAVKKVRADLSHPDLAERFLRERRILGRLDHPGIARVLDGGSTPDGQPWVAMEYVEGIALDRYCADNGLDVGARLRLFLRVCDAVRYAHRNLVIHRDLKPANILVTADGDPKLLDFGIAKMLDPDTGAPTTRSEVRVLTPEYASPEQVRGHPVDTTTDVYSLGVVLHELLTGTRPASASSDRDPSRAERPPVGLSGDLAAIVATALREETSERYASVEAFAEDLRRHLDGRPVLARRATAWYRVRKFILRNRVRLPVAATVVLALGALVAWHVERLSDERDAANAEREKAREVTRLLVDLLAVSDPSENVGGEISAREVLDEAARRLPRELPNQPDVRAALHHAIGTVYRNLGLYPQARENLDRAIAERRALGDAGARDLAESLAALAQLEFVLRDVDASRLRNEEALAILERALGPDDPDVAVVLAALGAVELRASRTDEGRARLERALAIHERSSAPDPDAYAEALDALAVVRLREDGPEPALALWTQALRLREDTHGSEHPKTLYLLGQVCYALRSTHRYEEAAAYSARQLDGTRTALGADHPEAAMAALGHSNVLFELGRLDEAEALRAAALEVFLDRFGRVHWYTAWTTSALARSALAAGRFDEAAAHFDDTLDIWNAGAVGNRPSRIATTLLDRAEVELARGERQAFARIVDQATAYLQSLDPVPAGSADYHTLVALRHAFAGQAAAALASADRALEDEDLAGSDGYWGGTIRLRLSAALALVGERERATGLRAAALPQIERTYGLEHPLARYDLDLAERAVSAE